MVDCLTGRQFNVKGELTQRRRVKPTATTTVGGGAVAGGVEGKDKRRKTMSVAEHVQQMAAASTEALQRPRKERERFRRFIVDVVTQGECVPGGRKKAPAAETAPGDAVTPAAASVPADKVPSTSSAPLTTGEKDLLR